jgi:uncharacterized protein YjbI with pentapeptide repeats
MLTVALLIAAAVAGVLLLVVPFRSPVKPQALSTTALYDLLKIAFAFAAGVGGVVALVTAYRRQRVTEFAQDLAAKTEQRIRSTEQHQRELATRAETREAARLFNERFTTAAGQLGSETPAVRLAGVYAMAGLADDWADQRQVCIDVLCAYLRMPYQPAPAEDAPAAEKQIFGALREVRHTVIRVITAHLQPEDHRAKTLQDWRGLDFDFNSAVFDGGSFRLAEFSGGMVDFGNAQFSGGMVDFSSAKFSGGMVDFSSAKFSGSMVDFSNAKFSGGGVFFGSAEFSGGGVFFGSAQFSGGTVSFGLVKFSGGTVSFRLVKFSGGTVDFSDAKFSGGTVSFGAKFSGGMVDFSDAKFSGGTVDFRLAEFSGSTVDFGFAQFSGGTVNFSYAKFNGEEVDFSYAKFSGGTVDFMRAGWTVPPLGLDKASIQPGVIVNLPGS